MGPSTGTGQRYAQALGELWPGVQRALQRLDAVAAEPEALEEHELVETLTHLQYHLHVGSEHVYGLQPPPGSASAHAELADALACARDATAEVAEAVAAVGNDGLRPLLHEWRGALFRVRLARLRLAAPTPGKEPADERPAARDARALAAFLLALAGAAAFAGGAALALWPLWVAGLVAVCGAVTVYRP